MSSIDEEIEAIEEEIRSTPYNKATSHHIGRLKGKLARLREEKEKREQQAGGGGRGYGVQKTGDATVGLVGPPSAGKSTLLNALTDADSEVAEYEFTTLDVVPGMMTHRGARIQLLDLPGLIEGAAEGKGRGREVLSVVRTTDMLLLMTDVSRTEKVRLMAGELHRAGVRLNQDPPKVTITQRDRGGLNITSTEGWETLTQEEAAAILREFGVVNADVVLRDAVDGDGLVDALSDNRVYLPALSLLNKVDQADDGGTAAAKAVAEEVPELPVHRVSALEGQGLDALRDAIYDGLGLLHVYLKPQGGEADMDEPMVLRRPVTVQDVARQIHRDVEKRFRYAVVTGDSAKFPEQQVGLDHELKDGDLITIVTKKKL